MRALLITLVLAGCATDTATSAHDDHRYLSADITSSTPFDTVVATINDHAPTPADTISLFGQNTSYTYTAEAVGSAEIPASLTIEVLRDGQHVGSGHLANIEYVDQGGGIAVARVDLKVTP